MICKVIFYDYNSIKNYFCLIQIQKNVVMKLLKLFAILLFVVSCKQSDNIYSKLEQVDAILYEEQDMMADSLLKSIKNEDLNTPKKKMYYNLLKTGLEYRMGNREQTDSLINTCVAFYGKTGDKDKLALSYYYRALVNWRTYDDNVLLDLKKAETQAGIVKNYGLLSKIYSATAAFNSNAEEEKSALKYIRKSVDAAEKSGKEWLLVYAYINSASIYKENNKQDSAYYYARQCEAYVEDLLPHYKAYVYYNIGSLLVGSNDSLAENYLKKSLEYQQLPQAYKSLADIYNVRGNRDATAEMWNKAVNNNAWLGLQTEILDAKADSEYERNDYAECCNTLKEKVNALTKYYESKLVNKVLELERKYDYNLQQQRFRSRMVVAGLLVIMLAVVTIFMHRIKVRRLQNEKLIEQSEKIKLSEQNERLEKEMAQMELEHKHAKELLKKLEERQRLLETDKKSTSKEVTILKKKIADLKTEIQKNMEKGFVLYNDLVAEKSPNNWTKQDFLFFFEYFSTVNNKFLDNLETEYSRLAPLQKIFLIADIYMHKDDKSLCKIFALEKQSLYNRRNRIAHKRFDSLDKDFDDSDDEG